MLGIVDSNVKIVTGNLIGWFDAAQIRSYPRSGSTWTDLSSTGRNITLYNSPTFSTSNGGILEFDGTNYGESAEITGSPISSWSMQIWINSNNITGAPIYYPMANGVSAIGTYFGGTFSQANGNEWGYFDGNTPNFQRPSPSLAINTWYLLTATWDNNTTSGISLNGAAKTTLAAGNTSNLTRYIIAQRGDGAWKFNGKISTAFIYNKVLSDAEILQNYNATKSRFGL